MDGIRDLEALIKADKEGFENFCHGCAIGDPCPDAAGSLDPVLFSLFLMDEEFSEVIETSELMSEIIACERVNSIYIDLVHVATCSDLTYALTWMFAMLLFFSCFGLLIVTFRAAILPPKKASDYNVENEQRNLKDNGDDGPPYAVQTGTSFQEPPIQSKVPSDAESDKEEHSDTESSLMSTDTKSH